MADQEETPNLIEPSKTETSDTIGRVTTPPSDTKKKSGARALMLVTLLAILLVVGVVWVRSMNTPKFTAGAAGAGDPYFPLMGNGGYDVQHYNLAFTYDPTFRSIDAVAAIDATATQNLSRFNLDFRQPLQVSKVTVDGQDASYVRDGIQELVVIPEKGLPKNHKFSVKVTYSGRPQDQFAYGPNGWMETEDGVIVLPQPNGTETFMPNNGTLKDKATCDFAITVPNDLQVIANGEPAGTTTKGDLTTYKWHNGNQTPGELVMLAIGKFDIKDTKTADGIRNITAIDPAAVVGDVAAANTAFNQRTADMTQWAESIYGPYPYTSTGGVQDFGPDINFSEESVSRSAYVHGQTAIPSTAIVAHELAHQYYGDLVTPARWQDVWLNEGFATYSEWLYSEQHGGQTAQQYFDQYYNDPETDWSGKVAEPGKDNFFGDLVYIRGAMTVHELRKTLGDDQFFKLLKAWPATHKNSNATVGDYVAFSQKNTKQDLSKLFRTWLYTEGKPTL